MYNFLFFFLLHWPTILSIASASSFVGPSILTHTIGSLILKKESFIWPSSRRGHFFGCIFVFCCKWHILGLLWADWIYSPYRRFLESCKLSDTPPRYLVIGVVCLANQHPKSTIKPTYLCTCHEFLKIFQPSCFIFQKYTGKRKGAVKMYMTVLKMRITCKQKCDQNIHELLSTEYTLFRFQSWNN